MIFGYLKNTFHDFWLSQKYEVYFEIKCDCLYSAAHVCVRACMI